MTNQEIFDKVWNHFQTQGKRSISNDTFCCQYRSNDGTKCAIGCLIPDELYNSQIEGSAVPSIEYMRARERYGKLSSNSEYLVNILIGLNFEPAQFPFLRDLQLIHDAPTPGWFGLDQMIREYREFAAANGLTIPATNVGQV